MLIPKYWAQHKQQFRSLATADNLPKQATIKRYGWSDISRRDALEHAKGRVAEAHKRWLVGEDILRRERKEEYNEGNGIPIREQIFAEQTFPQNASVSITQVIVTRNSYGAQVANVDNIAIIDVDNAELLHHLYSDHYDRHGFIITAANQNQPITKGLVWSFVIIFALIASIIAWQSWSWLWLIVVMVAATAFLWQKASKEEQARQQKIDADLASLLSFMTDLMQKRIGNYPDEAFRLYKTPAGFRIIAIHDTVLPSDRLIAEWFEYFHADANYVRLCQSQQCFRARLTSKPWRMTEVTETNKLSKNIPTKDFWSMPIDDVDSEENELRYAELEAREKWLADYDKFAKGYKACRYVESFDGREVSDSKPAPDAIGEFVDWHDRVCRVDKDLPLG
ncbi:hypothetical protein [uncultured Psychrobacter sp.]|uniref:hypothetical protein n=1 Tax=uncultured Psychrobacter sp. TaxID=259303 RepID=UPI0034591CCA